MLESKSKNNTKVCRIVEENLALKDLSSAAAIEPNHRTLRRKLDKVLRQRSKEEKAWLEFFRHHIEDSGSSCCEEENSVNLSKIYSQRLSRTKRGKAHEDFWLPAVQLTSTLFL